MEKQYKKIDFGFGKIDSAVEELSRYKERGELVYGVFNGEKLYSDVDDLDSAYVKVTGKTKADYDDAVRKSDEEYRAQKAEHEAAIPELTKEWVEKGNLILDEEYREKWAKCVPIRLDDLYQGMELKCCLDIVLELNNGCSLDAAKAIIDNQGHSGMSYSLVCSMVMAFCDRGKEFVSHVK